jgi:tetratricopeptide (TPR) repeat protein
VTPDRWRQIETVYEAVLDLAPEARADHLARVCGEDQALRDEVLTLLESTAGASAALRRAVAQEADRMMSSATAAQIGRRLGSYRLATLIGEGGMGAVFRATRIDAEFKRVVAIKILHRGLGTTHAAARFRDERQILATLDHPGIVKLIDGGSTEDGLPYLVMEHIEGLPITKFAREHRLSTRARVELIVKVCAAVQYAHQMLVVHRDIKPSNIIVDTAGEPKLLDFGIAKLLDEDVAREARTRTGSSLLTPEYASPEQARSEPVATASDVYSLGAVLYDLLAERPPIELSPNALESLRAICDVEPPRPSTVAPAERAASIAGDLDNIVLKALQKEPGRRYGSVSQLADDLQRHLDGLPVLARTATFAYRAGKFVRRHRGKLALATVVAASLASATIVSLNEAERADAQARRADDEAHRASARFNETRKLAGSLLFELDDRIRDLKGATAAREVVVTRAREYLDQLSRDVDADADTQLDLAFAYMKIGDIQGNANMANLGRPRDGLVSYVKAWTIIHAQMALGYAGPRLRSAYGLALFGIGMMQLSTVEPAAARASFRGVIEYWNALPADEKPGIELLVRANERMSHVSSDRRELIHYATAALELARTWAKDGSAEGRYWYGCALENLAPGLAYNGDPDAAAAHAREAIEVHRQLSREHPDDARYAREVAIANAFYTSWVAGVGNAEIWQPSIDDVPAAERAMRESVIAFERLSARDPLDARVHSDGATVIGMEAAVVALRDPRASVPLFERSIAAFDTMTPIERQSPYNQQNEWFTHCEMAEPLAIAGRHADAIAHVERGLAIAHAVGKDVRDNAIEAMCRYMAARTFLVIGNTSRATELLEQAASDLERVFRTGGIDKRIGYASVMRELARAQPARACTLLQQAADAWRQWPGDATPYVQRQQLAIDRDAAAACR